MDSRIRSVAKALTWQLIGFFATALAGCLFTGSLRAGGELAGVSAVSSLAAYLLHERLWAAIGRGRGEHLPSPCGRARGTRPGAGADASGS